MMDIQTKIDTLLEVIDHWLSNDNQYLMEAAGRTVAEGYFGEHDVRFALQALKKSIDREILIQWVERVGLTTKNDTSGQNVLCLHAGNLPLVGFQDALAVLLSGARYTGKISRKDPYLLPTFLNEVKKTDLWGSIDVQWSHHLDDLEGMQNDAILFAGSGQSVPGVMDAINKLNLSTPDTRFLIRTAHFSMAYFDEKNATHVEDLASAILRYGGKGCRSVAVVVSPYSLDEVKDELEEHIHKFWQQNPQHSTPSPRLEQQFAYNQAIERLQLWLDDFMLQEGGLAFDQDFIGYWVKGDEQKAAELAQQFGGDLQSIYTTHANVTIPGHEDKVEFLSNAQSPSISWKPDGVDTLQWLIK